MSEEKSEEAIDNYIRNNLSPKQDERDLIRERYEKLSEILKGVNFQSGSYARYTAITPVNDLDVIWEIDAEELAQVPNLNNLKKSIDPIELDASNILHHMAKRLESEYRKIGKQYRVEPRTHSVCIFFGKTDQEFSIDIVPAIITGDKNEYGDDIYKVPELIKLSKNRRAERYLDTKNPIEWIRSDPKGYIEIARELNETNENFRKAAKLVKSWRYSCKKQNSKFPLKSFHLELIISEIFNKNINLNCLEGISSFFEQLEDFLGTPHFVDRADKNRYVDDYIGDIKQDELIANHEFLSRAKELVQRIKSVTGQSEVEKLLDSLTNRESNIGSSVRNPQTRTIDAYSRPHCR